MMMNFNNYSYTGFSATIYNGQLFTMVKQMKQFTINNKWIDYKR